MPRRPSTIERTTMNVRLDQELRDRFTAAAYDYTRALHPDVPLRTDAVNVSEVFRFVLESWVEAYEGVTPGGREALAEALRSAQLAEHELALRKLQHHG